jgi:acyl carrier protein
MSAENFDSSTQLDILPEGAVTNALAFAIGRLGIEGVSLSSMDPKTDLYFDAELDSIDLIEIVALAAQSLGIDLSGYEEKGHVETIGDLWSVLDVRTKDYSAYEYCTRPERGS